MIDESPMLSRTARSEAQTVELRGECPREIVDVLDAISTARDLTRTELVNIVLRQWMKQTVHEATLVARVTRGNPMPLDPDGG